MLSISPVRRGLAGIFVSGGRPAPAAAKMRAAARPAVIVRADDPKNAAARKAAACAQSLDTAKAAQDAALKESMAAGMRYRVAQSRSGGSMQLNDLRREHAQARQRAEAAATTVAGAQQRFDAALAEFQAIA